MYDVHVSIYKYAKIFIKAGFSVNFLSSNIWNFILNINKCILIISIMYITKETINYNKRTVGRWTET